MSFVADTNVGFRCGTNKTKRFQWNDREKIQEGVRKLLETPGDEGESVLLELQGTGDYGDGEDELFEAD